jgi:type VI secretion system protein ImpM
MPGVTSLTCSFGFYGKIPARGDFVRAGLPRDFVDGWDRWLQQVMAESRVLLAEAWLPAWLEAPVWRFRLQSGVCGSQAALGVFMPSVDRAGRHFPLTLACVASDPELRQDDTMSWLDQAEEAGIATIEHDLDPDTLTERLRRTGAGTVTATVPDGACAWWTEGAPRVSATAFATDRLPDAALFARMLVSHPSDSTTRNR